MKNFNLSFYVKKDKVNLRGQLPIYVKLDAGGKKTTFATSYLIEQDRWKETKQLKIARKEKDILLRDNLNEIRQNLQSKANQIMEAGVELNAEKLKNFYLGKEEYAKKTSRTIIEAFQFHNAKFAQQIKVGDRAEASMVKFNSTETHLKVFIKYYYKRDDLPVDKLNFEFIDQFDLYLKSVKKIQNNTTVKYCQAVKKIVKMAIKYNWLDKNPFSEYEGKLKEVDTVYLDQEEIDLLENKIFATERLNIVKDLFLFTCYTGYAPCDVTKLSRDHMTKHFDGEWWIFKKREKTEIESNVMLIPAALRIIDKYSKHARCLADNSLLPIRSNQKVNEYLKEIADLCGITKTLHHYVARHTFATTIMLANGVPLETVSRMMGHKRITQTQHYAKIINRKVSEDMQNLKKILVKRESEKHKATDQIIAI